MPHNSNFLRRSGRKNASQRSIENIGAQDHARAATEGIVVYRLMAIGRVVPNLMECYTQQASILSALQDALAQGTHKHIGKECEDIEMNHQELRAASDRRVLKPAFRRWAPSLQRSGYLRIPVGVRLPF